MKFLIATIKSLLVTSNQSSDYERRRTTIEWLYANEKFAQQGGNAQPILPTNTPAATSAKGGSRYGSHPSPRHSPRPLSRPPFA